MQHIYSKADFAQLVFSRRKGEDFERVISFNVAPKSTVALELHWFYAGLAIHALDIDGAQISAGSYSLPDISFDLRGAINILAQHFETIEFNLRYVHDIMLVLTKDFTTSIEHFFASHHAKLSEAIVQYLTMNNIDNGGLTMKNIPLVSVRIMEGRELEFSFEGRYLFENENIELNGNFQASVSDNKILLFQDGKEIAKDNILSFTAVI